MLNMLQSERQSLAAQEHVIVVLAQCGEERGLVARLLTANVSQTLCQALHAASRARVALPCREDVALAPGCA